MKAAVVEAAIPNMGLTFKSAQDARGELDTFYNLLNDFDPSMIGGKLPDDGLYLCGVRRPSGSAAPWAWACCWVSGSWPRSVSPLWCSLLSHR